MRPLLVLLISLIAALGPASNVLAQFEDRKADAEALPKVPAGFEATLFAREPLVRQPCSMAFDAKGRLFVGMGPQYRSPKPDTPGDSVVIVLDTDGDGKADRTKVFATGFNAVQGLAWRGRDLWVANAPDLTVVRDLNGDDEADEYVLIYTDLGNLEHGLHGLNWAPDGKLYMSKGNSKGLTQPGRIAPKPFRDLWGVTAPQGSPDFPEPKTFRKGQYKHAYHDPADDWGREGGVLRCDDGGRNLEIISRGFRNPWDISFDSGFNWLGTDNDQTTGDRVFMPFYGAHFGWNHPWSSHWSDAPHPATAPVSGPLFEGSGTGVIYCDAPQFPATHRGVFFINDWLRKTTFIWRPEWDGALMRPKGGAWEPFAEGGKALFRPTDIEVGPDGALWILGWSSGYGAEWDKGQLTNQGRVFRIAWKEAPAAKWNTAKRGKALREWSVGELIEDFDGPLPIWRTDAQEELVRRGAAVKDELLAALGSGKLGEAQETWVAWTVGQIAADDASIDNHFSKTLDASSSSSLNLRIQAVRILGHRARAAGDAKPVSDAVPATLKSKEPRLRLAAVESLAALGQKRNASALQSLLANETDETTFYAGWQALRGHCTNEELRLLLADDRGGVRRGALLALLESGAIKRDAALKFASDADPGVREVVALLLPRSPRVASRPLNAPATPPLPGVSLVTNISTRSKREYRSFPGGLEPGAPNFIDRDYPLKRVPDALRGADFIQTSNDDDGSTGNDFLAFEALVPVRVHVGFDTRLPRPPAWVRDGFKRSDDRIDADHWVFQLYSRDYAAGRIELGGNTDDGKPGGKSHYIIVLEPLPLSKQSVPATLDQVMPLIDKGSAARGEILFKHRGGAGCAKCHSLGERKNSFGPELAGIGLRATAKHIVQSIVEPSAIITPGFTTQIVETNDGETHSGVLLEESGLSVTLGLATGEPRIIEKKQIAARRNGTASAMPDLAGVLTPQQVADLAAFLLSQTKNTAAGTSTAPAVEPKPVPPGSAASDTPVAAATLESGDWKLTTEPSQQQALIAYKGKAIAIYVWQDRETLRPFFKSVKTPSGVQVTRPHPPGSGEGNDHATMHPGIWLGFGSINNIDFWRNKGRVVQERFTPSAVKGEPIGFTVVNRYESPEGKPVCRLECRYQFIADADGYQLIVDCKFTSDQPLTFGVQEEMGLGVRVPTALTVKSGSGAIIDSNGGQNERGTWGKVGSWWDYHGKLEGKYVGMMVMSSPSNGEVWSHSRDYGVLVANPVRGKAVKVKAGETYRLTFGVQVHEHDDVSRLDRPAAFNRFKASLEKQLPRP